MDAKMAWKHIGLVALGAFCYSTLIIFTRLAHGLDALSIAFFRAFFAFLFFSLLLPRFSEPLHPSRYRSAIPALIGLGVAIGATAGLYIYAVQHTTAANAALLVNSAPIYIAVLAPLLLKEERPRYLYASLALIAVGIALITITPSMRDGDGSFGGILAGVASGFMYSLTMLFSRWMRQRVSGFTQTFWGTGVAALLLLPFACRVPLSGILRNLPVLVPLGIVSLGIASLLYFVALQKLRAQVVSVVAILEPVSGMLIGLWMFHEPLTLQALSGSLLILASIYLISRG